MELAKKDKQGRPYYNTSCKSCEELKPVRNDVLKRLKREDREFECSSCVSSKSMKSRSTKHGKYGTPAYISWQRMKDRCLTKDFMKTWEIDPRDIL